MAALAGVLGVGCANALAECRCADSEDPACKPPPPPEQPNLQYLLVQTDSDVTVGQPRKVEISPTDAYQQAREAVQKAAIRLPEECSNESAAQVTGESQRTDAIVKTMCGTWLAELEKALVKANFRVVSWDSLHGLERSKNLPAYVAAKELGADVLFLFNSLEASDVKAGGEAGARFQYFASDERGTKGQPFPLPDNERLALRNFVQAKTKVFTGKEAAGVVALSSTLDSTAILTSTGESVWFYRNTTVKPVTKDTGARFLFAKYNGAWYPASRDFQLVAAIPSVTMSAEDVMQGSVSASKDPYATERLDLVRSVANDFVGRFRSGQAGD
jgi:hypothetical protein